VQEAANIAFSPVSSQFMVGIHSGLLGLVVAGHVMEESKSVIVHAPNLRLQTEGKAATDWD